MAPLIPADSSLCDTCLQELKDPNNRRYQHPFINCVHCGPRFTIIKALPYDRSQTTLHAFPLCQICQQEYDHPNDRRFHAQPIACPNCGPQLSFYSPSSSSPQPLSSPLLPTLPAAIPSPLQQAIVALRTGQVVAIKGIGGYHLAVAADNPVAIATLRQRKQRPDKPLALMVANLTTLTRLATLSAAEQKVLTSPAHPIVLVRKKKSAPLAANLAPNSHLLGVMLPYTPLHHLIMAQGPFSALVMTSGNKSHEPMIYEDQQAKRDLSGLADHLLIGSRPIQHPLDDAIVRLMAQGAVVLRRARGYVPLPLFLSDHYPTTLALGGDLKNSFCLLKGHYAYLGPHLGDLQHEKNHDAYQLALTQFLQLFGIKKIDLLAYDHHPNYAVNQLLSTHYPEAKRVAVQHHHAHLVSLLAEQNQVKIQVGAAPRLTLGVIFDGTGYGEQGPLWGGEFLVGDAKTVKRWATVAPLPLPGGEIAIKEPWRIAVAVLQQLYGDAPPALPVPWLGDDFQQKRSLISSMMRQNLNTPWSHGVGRYFDLVAALLGRCQAVSFEGQNGLQLEAQTALQPSPSDQNHYPFEISHSPQPPTTPTVPLLLDLYPMLRALIETQCQQQHPLPTIITRFHNTLVYGTLAMAKKIRTETGVQRVALSGGVFQNRYLSDQLGIQLQAAGFTLLRHQHVPPNDGGLALGQAIIAAQQNPLTTIHD